MAVGVLSPLDLPVVDQANFLGYVLYSLWLIAFGIVLLVRERRASRVPGPDGRAAPTEGAGHAGLGLRQSGGAP